MMKRLMICIIDHGLKYETGRCHRYLREMEINEKDIVPFKYVSRLQTIDKEYIAFWDVLDKWDLSKLEVCMPRIAESDADVIIHSYIQHVGFKGILYNVPDSGQADMTQILCQGLPGISAMIFRREWLLKLLSDQNDVEIGSEEFYRLLAPGLKGDRCKIELIAKPLSEHWSYYGRKTPSVKLAKDNMLKYWNIVDVEARNKLIPVWYEYFKCNYGEFPITEFMEGVSMSKEELAELLRVREETLTQQIQTLHSGLERKNDFYLFMRNWVELHQSGRSIADELLRKNISTVAIYGAGKHGKMLYNELKATNVKVVCWIDQNSKEETLEECPVVGADDELPKVDAVIVTPYREFPSIENSLREKTKAQIIPLDILVRR